MKHGKLPWSIGSRRPYIVAMCDNHRRNFITFGKLDASQGCCDWPVISSDERKANAEFIVKACNNHDKLVEALKGLLGDCKDYECMALCKHYEAMNHCQSVCSIGQCGKVTRVEEAQALLDEVAE